MEDSIGKPIERIASTDAVEQDPSNQATPPFQGKIVGSSGRAPLPKQPTGPTPRLREKMVGPFCRYPLAKRPISKAATNPNSSIEAELAEVRKAWQRYQATNGRNAVYIYLEAVFALVRRWQHLNCAVKNSRAALRLQHAAPPMKPETFGIVIFCTADPRGRRWQDPQQMVTCFALRAKNKFRQPAFDRFYKVEWRAKRMCSPVRPHQMSSLAAELRQY
jgi:hypothetical protein